MHSSGGTSGWRTPKFSKCLHQSSNKRFASASRLGGPRRERPNIRCGDPRIRAGSSTRTIPRNAKSAVTSSLIDFPVKTGQRGDWYLRFARNVQFLTIRERIFQRNNYESGISTDLWFLDFGRLHGRGGCGCPCASPSFGCGGRNEKCRCQGRAGGMAGSPDDVRVRKNGGRGESAGYASTADTRAGNRGNSKG